MINKPKQPISSVLPDTIGQPCDKTIQVEIGTRFLEHFSEQLYSSPQKAFEELITNGWDAGADHVDVRISKNLFTQSATMAVFDNGASMDMDGLENLWQIAFSPKEANPVQYGRHVIGKFGIGKLATYVLANKLTYICKASDGVIRRVTMDYGSLNQNSEKPQLVKTQPLTVYEVQEEEVEQALGNIDDGEKIFELIKGEAKKPEIIQNEDEYGGNKCDLTPKETITWTLVILSDLKKTGRDLKAGILKRMLESALPFGSEMAITLNDSLLTSSKINFPVIPDFDWRLGPDLKIDSFEIEYTEKPQDNSEPGIVVKANDKKDSFSKIISLQSGNDIDGPYVDIPKIGRVTGRVRVFDGLITGGKSEERGPSNGFHVNVLGRLVNQADNAFGEENLSHASWARFRMAIRADGLNNFLVTNREQFKETEEVKIFRAFLRKVFNMARTKYDSYALAGMENSGDILVKSLGVLSLNPLKNIVAETLKSKPSIPSLFDESGIEDREAKRLSWQENTSENIKNALEQVKYEKLEDESFVKFRISDNSIVVNKEHPFVEEHSSSKKEKELVRTVALINFLSDMYALDIGVEPNIVENIIEYRDKLMKFKSLQRRQSGSYIAKLLLQVQHDSTNYKKLEAVVSDALDYIGFEVTDLAKSGEPEGIARAYTYPTNQRPGSNPTTALYSFSFDAKSSKYENASTGNIKLDGIVEHQKRYSADYALVIAPGFTDGALVTRCEEQKVTAITTRDLGKLLEYTVEFGAIPTTKLRELFSIYDFKLASKWIDDLQEWISKQRNLTVDIFIKALKN